jgi:hypothetical protein
MRSLPSVEVIELQRFALPVIVGVLGAAGMWNDDQPVPVERPRKPQDLLQRVIDLPPKLHDQVYQMRERTLQ